MNYQKAYDVDELEVLYNRMLENLKLFSLSGQDQIEQLRGYAIADEVASSISDNVKPYATILFQNKWITLKQFEIITTIDRKLAAMSKDKRLWTDRALEYAIEWQECRALGNELLGLLK